MPSSAPWSIEVERAAGHHLLRRLEQQTHARDAPGHQRAPAAPSRRWCARRDRTRGTRRGPGTVGPAGVVRQRQRVEVGAQQRPSAPRRGRRSPRCRRPAPSGRDRARRAPRRRARWSRARATPSSGCACSARRMSTSDLTGCLPRTRCRARRRRPTGIPAAATVRWRSYDAPFASTVATVARFSTHPSRCATGVSSATSSSSSRAQRRGRAAFVDDDRRRRGRSGRPATCSPAPSSRSGSGSV